MDTIQVQAQTILKKYRTARLLSFLGVLLLIGGCFWAIRHTQYVLAALLLVLYGLTVRISKVVLPNKYIYAVLTKQMDAPLFAEVIAEMRRTSTDAHLHLNAEWYNGRFQNVVSLCRQLLSDPQVLDRHHYVFFVYLANVYFDVGDEENLRLVCDRFEEKLQSDKKAARIRKIFLRMQVFRQYLNRDFDAIEAISGPEPKDPLTKAFRTFRRARTALLQGETAAAREMFVQIAAECPKLHYSMLAQRAVEAIDSGREYREMFDDTEPTEEFPIPQSFCSMRSLSKKFQVFRRICLILGSICIIAALGLYIYASVHNRYEERLHTVMEEQFDDVELLTTFWPEKDGEAIDSMFICRISDGLVVGSSYRHKGEKETYVALNAWIPEEFLKTSDSQYTGSFFCTTSDYYVTGGLYHEGQPLPEEYCHIEVFTVDGKTFYYVITDIEPGVE